MKRVFLVFSMLFLFTTNAFAVAENLEITNCTTSGVKIAYFEVDDAGWYYVSIPFDSSKSDWYYVTPFFPKSIGVTNTDSTSFFVVTDWETSTPVVGKCL